MYQLYEKRKIDFVKLYVVIERIVLQRMPEIAWLVDRSGLVEECSKNEKRTMSWMAKTYFHQS